MTEWVTPYLDKMNVYKWADAELDGKYFAMPWDSGPVVFYYRRDVFEAACFSNNKANNYGRLYEMMLWQQGLGYYNAEGEVTVDSSENIATLETLKKFW